MIVTLTKELDLSPFFMFSVGTQFRVFRKVVDNQGNVSSYVVIYKSIYFLKIPVEYFE
jgi:hypothetical protein